MTALLFIVNCLAFASGQLLLKRAMSAQTPAQRSLPAWLYFSGGVAGLAISFFLSLGLLQRFELSFFFSAPRCKRHRGGRGRDARPS